MATIFWWLTVWHIFTLRVQIEFGVYYQFVWDVFCYHSEILAVWLLLNHFILLSLSLSLSLFFSLHLVSNLFQRWNILIKTLHVPKHLLSWSIAFVQINYKHDLHSTHDFVLYGYKGLTRFQMMFSNKNRKLHSSSRTQICCWPKIMSNCSQLNMPINSHISYLVWFKKLLMNLARTNRALLRLESSKNGSKIDHSVDHVCWT